MNREAMQPAREESLTHKAVAGVSWSTAATVARQILSFAGVAVLARLLGPAAYGIMGMAGLIILFLQNFRDLGTTNAIIQLPSVSSKLLSTLFWANCLLGLAFCGVMIATAPAVARFFHEPELTPIMSVLSISFCIISLGVVPSAVLSREMAFGQLALADFSSALAGYLVAIPCAFAGLGVWSLVYANLTNYVVAAVLYVCFCRWRPALEFDPAALRSVMSFSLNLSGFTFVNYFARNSDNLIVGRSLGNVPLGYYQMAYNLMMYPIQNVSAVVAQVLFPAFSRMQDDNERFRSAWVRSCMLIGLITFPVIAGLATVADPFVRTFLGAKWIPAIIIFQILAPAGLLQSVQNAVGHIYMVKARTDLMFRWGILFTAVYVGSFLIGVRFGIAGVATAYCIVYFTLVAYPIFSVPFRLIDLRFRDFARQLAPQIGITLLMVCVAALWLRGLRLAGVTNNPILLFTTVAIGGATYIALMLRLRPPVIFYLEEILDHSRAPAARYLLAGMAALRGRKTSAA